MRHEDGDGDDDDAKRCSTPFRKILLQVPLSAFCVCGLGGGGGLVRAYSFIAYLRYLIIVGAEVFLFP